MNHLKKWIASALSFAVLGSPVVAQSEGLESFYSGETVTVLIGHPPGGTFNLYAQLAASHLGNHIPGNPEVIVQHMPGGGGSLAAAFFSNKAPTDGTMIAVLPETLAIKQVMAPDDSLWDMNRMRYIGRFTDVTSVMGVRKGAPATTIEGLRDVGGNFACSGTTTGSAQTGALAHYFAGFNLNMVCGYDTATAGVLAILRGEADLTSTIWTNWNATQREHLDSGDIIPVVQFGLKPNEAIADVPLAMDLVDDPEARAAFRLFAASGEVGRALLASPDMEEDKYQMFVDAFASMIEDPAFIADAETSKVPLNIALADELEEIKALILATPDEQTEILKVALEEGFK